MDCAESYALQEEQKQLLWEARFSKRETEDYKRVNLLLEQRKYDELIKLYTQAGYGDFYSGRSAFVSMNLAMKIYLKDCSLENHIFWNVDSIPVLEEKLQKLKFIIWRLEYFGVSEVEELLLAYMIEHRPSDWLLKYMICATTLQEKQVMLDCAGIFFKWNMAGYAESLVSYLEKR